MYLLFLLAFQLGAINSLTYPSTNCLQSDWDDSHTLSLSHSFLNGQESYHDNGREDHRFKWKYCQPATKDTPQGTDIIILYIFSPPCYTNYRPDYETSDSVNYTASAKQSIADFMQWSINWWPNNYPPSKRASGYSLFTGADGAQIHLRLYNHTLNKTYLSIANAYIQSALSELPARPTYASYMFGNTGVWALASIIEGLNGNAAQQQKYLNDLVNLFQTVQKAINAGQNSVDGIDLTKLIVVGAYGCTSISPGLCHTLYPIDSDVIPARQLRIYDYSIKRMRNIIFKALEFAPGGEIFDISYYRSALEQILAYLFIWIGTMSLNIKPQNLLF